MSDVVGLAPKGEGYELRNDCRKLFSSTEHQVMLSGPAETGKTVAACLKAHAICTCVPNSQGAIVRKTSASLPGTVLRTFQRIIAPDIKRGTVRVYGGETPGRFIYTNGSTIWTGGMDNSDSVLSSERDFIYANQAEELTLNDWEVLSTRCSGRASVVMHPQLFGDCNPSSRLHWIRERAAQGKLRLLVSTHRDNPTLYDEAGNLTEQGVRTMAVLDALTGVRKLRLKDGIWATAEGAIYDEFNIAIHVCERDPNEMVVWYLAMDEGFTHPSVCLLVGADADRRWHIFEEFYKVGVVPEDVVAHAAIWNKAFGCVFAACDSAGAGLIASLRNAGVNAIGAEKGPKSITDGISAIKDRLHPQKKDTSAGFLEGRPRLTVSSKCESTIKEFEAYRWKPEKDQPIDSDNHAMDALRYLNAVLTEGTGIFDSTSKVYVPPVPQAQFVHQRGIFVPRTYK